MMKQWTCSICLSLNDLPKGSRRRTYPEFETSLLEVQAQNEWYVDDAIGLLHCVMAPIDVIAVVLVLSAVLVNLFTVVHA